MTARRLMIFVLLGVLLAASCSRKAMSLFFDVPEATPQPTANVTRVAMTQALPEEDTIRPPIEEVFDPDSVLALLPRDAAGAVDWVAALREGVIRPRPNLPDDPRPPSRSVFQFDFLYQGAAPMLDARMPHSAHVEWLSCQTCHPGIFPYRDAEITMAAINEGELCGTCHGPVAFPATDCQRCHAQMPGAAEPELLGDITLARAGGARGYPLTSFPHWVHRIRYQCAACHNTLFQPRAGADTLSMAMLAEGQACGRCHDGINAFPVAVETCSRCHSVEPSDSAATDTAAAAPRSSGILEKYGESRHGTASLAGRPEFAVGK